MPLFPSPDWAAAFLACQVALREEDLRKVEVLCFPLFEEKEAFLYSLEGLVRLAYETGNRTLISELEKFYDRQREAVKPPLSYELKALFALREGDLEGFFDAGVEALRSGSSNAYLLGKLFAAAAVAGEADKILALIKASAEGGIELNEEFIFEELLKPPLAAAVLKKLVAESPTPRRYLFYAKALLELGKVAEAERVLKRAVEEFPRSSELKNLLVRVLVEEDKLSEAKKYLSPETERTYYLAVLENAEDFAAFKRTFEEALSKFPDDPEILRRGVAVFTVLGADDEMVKAGEAWTETLEGLPDGEVNLLAAYLVRKICLGKPLTPKEKKLLEENLDRQPLRLAALLKGFKEGKPDWRILNTVDPRELPLYLQPLYGVLELERLREEGELDEAVLDDADEFYGVQRLLFWSACVDQRLKEWLIETFLSRPLKSPAECAAVLKPLFLLPDPEGAELALRLCLERFPTVPEFLNSYGYLLAELYGPRLLDEAEKLVKKALELDPDSPYAADSLGWIYFKKGDYERAKLWLERALEKLPDDPVVNAHYGELLLKMGRPCEAKEYLLKAREELSLRVREPEVGIRERVEKLLEEARVDCRP
ncbi:MAG: tetratricopeptide repeat protein [Aquificae bacterium]|nr:tetratricopeptide repeat protein [Aquificota bacterium]